MYFYLLLNYIEGEAMKKGVMVYGYGKLGKAVLKGLYKLGVYLFDKTYNASGQDEFIVQIGNQLISVENSSRLTGCENPNLFEEYNKKISYIVVTIPGKVLEEEIDFLVKFKVPLIICSTGYDGFVVIDSLLRADISAVLSDNMALGIIDFWIRLHEMKKVPDGSTIFLESALESHQSGKADISGSILKTFTILKGLGILIDFDKSEVIYNREKDGKYGCLSWLREEHSQIFHGVPEEFLDGHGYHSLRIVAGDDLAETQNYMEELFVLLNTLSSYTIEGIFRFSVILEGNCLIITHNINGREIYSKGIFECIKLLDTSRQAVIYSGEDVVYASMN